MTIRGVGEQVPVCLRELLEAKVVEASVTLNYTTVLNIVFLGLAGVLVWRYFRRGGGFSMLRMMEEPMEHGHAHT